MLSERVIIASSCLFALINPFSLYHSFTRFLSPPFRCLLPLPTISLILNSASQRHAEVAKASKIGQGVDRHLQGLYWTAQQMVHALLASLPAVTDL